MKGIKEMQIDRTLRRLITKMILPVKADRWKVQRFLAKNASWKWKRLNFRPQQTYLNPAENATKCRKETSFSMKQSTIRKVTTSVGKIGIYYIIHILHNTYILHITYIGFIGRLGTYKNVIFQIEIKLEQIFLLLHIC